MTIIIIKLIANSMQTSKPLFQRPGVYVTSKILVICIPGFILTNSFGIFLSFIIPGEQLTVVTWVTLMAFLFYSLLIMWVFHEKSLKVIWLGLIGAIAVTALTSALLLWSAS